MLGWYLVFSKPRQEQQALTNLRRQGYEVYLPRIRNRRRFRGRWATLIEPMFPRYMFIHLSDETDNWGPIRSTLGVAALVRFGDLPARVPDDLVTALRERDDREGIQDLPSPDFQSGDRVRIVAGAMAGYEGIYQCRTGKERVIVLLDIVGTATQVTMRGDDLEIAERTAGASPRK